jgi:imidazolonepropionase-like amidohydrolase
MSTQFLHILAPAVVLAGAAETATRPVPPRDSTTAFVDVAVLPMDRDRVLEHQTVIVRGAMIAAIGPAASTTVPPDAARIDGRGRFLMPGLVDMHAHFLPGACAPGDDAHRQFVWFLANGVTAARGLGAPPGFLATRDRTDRGDILAPTLYVAGGSIHGGSVTSAAEAAGVVRAARAAGYDWIKTHGGIDRQTYDSMMAAARAEGIPVSGHVSHEYGLWHALASGQQVEHLDGYLAALAGDTGSAGAWNDGQIVTDSAQLARIDESRMPEVVRATVRSGTCAGPTLALFRIVAEGTPADAMAAWPEMQFVSPAMVKQFRSQVEQFAAAAGPGARRFIAIRDRLVKALYDGGVPLVAGGDSPQLFMVPGFSLHREMQAFRDAGIPLYGVLAAATVNAARCLGRAAEFGTVSIGRRADLLLLDADPRRALPRRDGIAGVMTRGRWLDRETLARMLDELRAR